MTATVFVPMHNGDDGREPARVSTVSLYFTFVTKIV